jgi:hypothetical protein
MLTHTLVTGLLFLKKANLIINAISDLNFFMRRGWVLDSCVLILVSSHEMIACGDHFMRIIFCTLSNTGPLPSLASIL